MSQPGRDSFAILYFCSETRQLRKRYPKYPECSYPPEAAKDTVVCRSWRPPETQEKITLNFTARIT